MAGLGLIGAALAATAALCLGSGCALGYYAQSASGHLELMHQARPVKDWLAEEKTPAALRERLALSQRMRDYAVAELKLPDNTSYRAYADLKRSAVVWNVVATPELSLTLKTWCFPVMGCVGYRGYFDQKEAEGLAAQLKAEGLETSVYGVPAYSTLGWLNWAGGDPLLSTFIHWPEGELARMIFHELAHQVAYAADDTQFNESFATAVERIGGARWLATQGSAAARAEYAALDERRRDFRELTRRTRARLDALYKSAAGDAEKRAGKAAVMAQLRAEVEALKVGRWGGFKGYDGWVERANNAALGVQGAYDDSVGAFEKLFERSGADFTRFYADVKQLAALPKAQRQAQLNALHPPLQPQ